jgi:hypothetical protein
MSTVQLPQDPIPVNRVNIYVTRDVAFNLEKMVQVTKTVLGRLGCDQCHSGRILDFHIIEDFVVNPKSLDVHDLPGAQRF